MNAKLLEKLVVYREAWGLKTARILLSRKIQYQCATIGIMRKFAELSAPLKIARTIQELLLAEARAARVYWRYYGLRVSKTTEWNSRMPQSEDPCNQLLDIGYHYLSQEIFKMCTELNIPTELGIFHRAQSAHAHPLVYDFMEWLRAPLVDTAVRIFFSRKKRRIAHIREKDIRQVIGAIKRKFEQRYYHRRLGYCVTFAYWNRLILLAFEKAVRENKPFEPLFPSLRHETRCKKNRSRKNAER